MRGEPHWFVQWCMQSLRANMDTFNDRLDSPATILGILGPLTWIRMAAVVWFSVNLTHSPWMGMELANTDVCAYSGYSTDMAPTGTRPTTQHSHWQ